MRRSFHPSPPPIIGTAVASWVFLLRNFGHALWLGWPYLAFLTLSSLPFFFMNYLSFVAHTAPDSFFENFQTFAPFGFFANFLYIFIDPLFMCCLAIGWMRAITRGVSHKNRCSLRDEWKLVLCCIAQMLAINILWYFQTFLIGVLGIALFYVFSLILPQALTEPIVIAFSAIPNFLTAILFVSLFPLIFLAPSFLYFPAKANEIVISSNLGRKLFKGLSLRFMFSTALGLLPLGILLLLYFLGTDLLNDSIKNGLIETEGFYAFHVFLAFFIVSLNFLLVLIFSGVLSGYYLWVRENRIKQHRQKTAVPDDPFSDEGWDGPMWEDFR